MIILDSVCFSSWLLINYAARARFITCAALVRAYVILSQPIIAFTRHCLRVLEGNASERRCNGRRRNAPAILFVRRVESKQKERERESLVALDKSRRALAKRVRIENGDGNECWQCHKYSHVVNYWTPTCCVHCECEGYTRAPYNPLER